MDKTNMECTQNDLVNEVEFKTKNPNEYEIEGEIFTLQELKQTIAASNESYCFNISRFLYFFANNVIYFLLPLPISLPILYLVNHCNTHSLKNQTFIPYRKSIPVFVN